MTIEPAELLDRLSATLRNDVAPEVADEYTRTQAHMASVILAKLSKQLARGEADGAAERADVADLHAALAGSLSTAPPEVVRAASGAAAAGTVAALGPLIEALYTWGLHNDEAAAAMAEIRPVLRRDIDRRMEIAR